jgi:hypothetical protein
VRDAADGGDVTLAATPPAKRATSATPARAPERTPTPTPTPTPSTTGVPGRPARPLVWLAGGAIVVAAILGAWLAARGLRTAPPDRATARSLPARPRDAAPAPAPAPTGPPRLVLRGQEGVLVFIDGRRRGITPVTIDDTPFDRPRVVTLIKRGFQDRRVTLPVIPAGGEHVIDVALEPSR